MVYNTVKHRRGTTEEWALYDIIPEEGELVVEECSDNFCRAKIGDGIHAFSDLKYIDDFTYDKLFHKLQELDKNISADLYNLDTKTVEQLSLARNELNESIASMTDSLRTEFRNADNASIDKVKQDIDTKVNSVVSDITSLIDNTVDDFSKQLTAIDMQTTRALADKVSELNEEIASVSSRLITKLDDNVQNLDTKLTQNLFSEVSRLDNYSDTLNSDIKAVEDVVYNNVQPAITELDVKLAGDIADINYKHKSDITEVSNKISDEATKLSARLDGAIIELNNSINSSAIDLTTACELRTAALHETINAELVRIKTKQADQFSSLENMLHDEIAEVTTQHTADYTDLKENITLVDSDLTSKIATLKQQNDTIIKDIESQLVELYKLTSKLDKNDSTLIEQLSSVNNILSDIATQFSTEITELATRYSSEQPTIIAKLNELEAIQTATSLNLANTLNTYISNIYVELLDLVDDDVLILEKVFSVQNSLSDRISLISTEITTDFEAVDNKISNVRADLQRTNDNITNILAKLEFAQEEIANTNEANNTRFNLIESHLIDTDHAIDLIEEKLTTLSAPASDAKLRPDLDNLTSIVNDPEKGLAITHTLADGAEALARLNTVKIADIDADRVNYIRFEADMLQVEEDVIVFMCGNATDTIIVE